MCWNTQTLQYRRISTTPKHAARLNVTFNETQLKIVFDGKPDTIDHE